MRRILVFQLARLGDLVQSKRLMMALAAEEHAEVHLCVDTTLLALAGVLYPFAVPHGLPVHAAAEGGPAAVFEASRVVFAELSAIAFDEVYVLNSSPPAFACAALFEPEQIRGYRRANGQEGMDPWPQILLNLVKDRRFSPVNLVDAWAAFHPSPPAPEKVNPIPRAAGSGRIGVALAGQASRRSLPPHVLAACLQAIFQARGGPEIVCIGSSAERPLVRRLLRELPQATGGKIIDCAGTTALTDLPDLLRGLDMLVTPDTGVMHLAAHLGVPVQAFFLSSAWCWETGPYGFGHKVWQALTPCSPCLESAPCSRPLPDAAPSCLPPFADKAFLAHLSGKYTGEWPENLLGCISMLDDLGVYYRTVDGDDPYALARSELRKGVSAWLSPPPFGETGPVMRADIAGFFFSDKDWMLPSGPMRGRTLE